MCEILLEKYFIWIYGFSISSPFVNLKLNLGVMEQNI